MQNICLFSGVHHIYTQEEMKEKKKYVFYVLLCLGWSGLMQYIKQPNKHTLTPDIVNRPGVAGAALQTAS